MVEHSSFRNCSAKAPVRRTPQKFRSHLQRAEPKATIVLFSNTPLLGCGLTVADISVVQSIEQAICIVDNPQLSSKSVYPGIEAKLLDRTVAFILSSRNNSECRKVVTISQETWETMKHVTGRWWSSLEHSQHSQGHHPKP